MWCVSPGLPASARRGSVREAAAIARVAVSTCFHGFLRVACQRCPFHVVARLLRDAARNQPSSTTRRRAHRCVSVCRDAADDDVLLLYDLMGIRDPR